MEMNPELLQRFANPILREEINRLTNNYIELKKENRNQQILLNDLQLGNNNLQKIIASLNADIFNLKCEKVYKYIWIGFFWGVLFSIILSLIL